MTSQLHENFESNPLSDHLPQTGEFTIGETTVKVITHNMLNKCTLGEWPDNAWNIGESFEEYKSRLDLLAEQYSGEIKNGATIIALQEAPREPLAAEFFNKIKELSENSELKYIVNNTGYTDEQALMFIYNAGVLGESKESLMILDERAQSFEFEIGKQYIKFINIHALYKPSDNDQREYAEKVINITNDVNGEIKIRFGDHNANKYYYHDLLVAEREFPTSVSYDISNKCFSFIDDRDKLPKNYDGFAVSKNFLENDYLIYASELMSSTNSNFPVISIIPAYDGDCALFIYKPGILGDLSYEKYAEYS